MQNKRTTAQINAHTLARLKALAKDRHQTLYSLIDEAVLEYLKQPANPLEKISVSPTRRKKNILHPLQQLQQIQPLIARHKLLTSGIAALAWLVYSTLTNE